MCFLLCEWGAYKFVTKTSIKLLELLGDLVITGFIRLFSLNLFLNVRFIRSLVRDLLWN